MEKNFEEFEQVIGVEFRDKALLKQAFTHRSYLNEARDGGLGHNERLEFLGDAVLELATTVHLYDKYPETAEGELTSYRAGLVNTISIGSVATELGMNDYLLLSRGEAKDEGRARQYILADAFEALIAAIFLDQGYEVARDFIARFLLPKTEEIVEKRLWQDAKSLFQERSQERYGITPAYQVLLESGPDHNKIFTCGVFLKNDMVAEASGASKQEAEQSAAEKALKTKGWR